MHAVGDYAQAVADRFDEAQFFKRCCHVMFFQEGGLRKIHRRQYAAGVCELNCVRQEIDQDLLQLELIGTQHRQVIR